MGHQLLCRKEKNPNFLTLKLKNFPLFLYRALHFEDHLALLFVFCFTFFSLRLPKMPRKRCKSVCQSSSASLPASILSKNSHFFRISIIYVSCLTYPLNIQFLVFDFVKFDAKITIKKKLKILVTVHV